MLCVRSCFLLFLCGFTQKIHSFCVYLSFSKPPSSLLSSSSGRPLLSCWWGCKIYKRCKLFFWHFISFIFNWFKESFKFRKHISGSMKHSGWTWKAFYRIRHLIGFLLDLSLLLFFLFFSFFSGTPQENFSRNFCSHAIWRFYSLWIYFLFIYFCKIYKKNFLLI